MAREPKMEFKCDKCGKLQSKNKKKSNGNWDVFSCNQKCDCGGTFVMFIDGHNCG